MKMSGDASDLAARQDVILAAFDDGCWDVGLTLLVAGLRRYPRDPGLWALSAYAHLQTERYEDAEDALRLTIACGMDEPEVRYCLELARRASSSAA